MSSSDGYSCRRPRGAPGGPSWPRCLGCRCRKSRLAIYRRHTGRQRPPEAPAREAWVVVGRRGGKSRVAALVAVWLACFRDYRAVLAPGEPGTLMVIAADRRQARVVFRYIEALLDGVPMLASLVGHRTRESIMLTNRVTIEVHTASLPGHPGLHADRRRLRRACLLALRGQREPRHGDPGGAPTGNGDRSGGAPALHQLGLCPPRSLVGGVSRALGPGRRPSARVAGRYPGDEPDRGRTGHR